MANNSFRRIIRTALRSRNVDIAERRSTGFTPQIAPAISCGRRTADKSVRILHNRCAVRPRTETPSRAVTVTVLGGCCIHSRVTEQGSYAIQSCGRRSEERYHFYYYDYSNIVYVASARQKEIARTVAVVGSTCTANANKSSSK